MKQPETVPGLPLRQHAPVGGGGLQVVLVQTEPAPCQTPPWAVHWDSERIWQLTPAGLVRQHAPLPLVLEQVKVPHVVPGPRQIPPAAVHSA